MKTARRQMQAGGFVFGVLDLHALRMVARALLRMRADSRKLDAEFLIAASWRR